MSDGNDDSSTRKRPSPIIGCLLLFLVVVTLALKSLLVMFAYDANTRKFLVIANWISFGLIWIVIIGGSIFTALSKVRFSLGKMITVIWSGGACITCIVASTKAEVIAIGIFGLVILTAYLIAGVARAGIGDSVNNNED